MTPAATLSGGHRTPPSHADRGVALDQVAVLDLGLWHPEGSRAGCRRSALLNSGDFGSAASTGLEATDRRRHMARQESTPI